MPPNPASEVIKETIWIQDIYKFKVGCTRVNEVTRKPLTKFLNTVAALALDVFTAPPS
jgi:hypothetical protein